MKKAEISAFFAGIDSAKYTFGDTLEMDEVSQITLKTNAAVYPDKTLHVIFDGDTEQIYLVKGYYSSGSFVKVSEIGTYPFSEILGFVMVNPYNIKSPYMLGRSC
jgi:hypothetical protein